MIRRIRNRLAAQDGFTLIELLVATAIGVLVISAAMYLTEVAGRTAARVEDRVDSAQRARIAMDRIGRELRAQVCLDGTTPPIIVGDANSVTFYSDYDAVDNFRPEKRRLTFSATGNGSIVEEIYDTTSTQAPWAFPATPTSTRTLLTYVGLDNGTPFFTYYSRDVAGPLATPLSTNTTSRPLAPNSIAKVVRVDIAFETRPTSGRTGPERRSRLSSTVVLRNVDNAATDTSGITWGPRCA
jgi:prepilin-type N-terminal cleavage/methylation domain-containing protein